MSACQHFTRAYDHHNPRAILDDPDASKIREASLCIAVKQMYDLLADFDPAPFIQKLADDPQNYSRILNALSKLAEAGLRYDRLRAEEAHRTAVRAKEKIDPKTLGLPDQARVQIEDE